MSTRVISTLAIIGFVGLCLLKKNDEYNLAVAESPIDMQTYIIAQNENYKQELKDHYAKLGITDFDITKHQEEFKQKYGDDIKPVDITSATLIVSGQPVSMNSMGLNPLSNEVARQRYLDAINSDPNHHAMY